MQPINSEKLHQIQSVMDTFVAAGPNRCISEGENKGAGRSVSFSSIEPASQILSVSGGTARPAASVIKLPLFMAACALHQKNQLPQQTFTKHELGTTRYASIISAFEDTHAFTLMEMIKLGIITSDNPIAVAITKLVPFQIVNSFMAAIGCSQGAQMQAGFTEDELGPKGRVNTLSTDDCIVILSEINARYPLIYDAMANNLRNSRLNLLLPETWEAPHKTGSLEGVVNDIGLVANKGRKFAVAFLTDGEPSPEKTSAEIAATTLKIAEIFFA